MLLVSRHERIDRPRDGYLEKWLVVGILKREGANGYRFGSMMRHTESGISMPGVIASGAIHAVIIGALIYGVHATTNDVVPPPVVGVGFSIRRDRDISFTIAGSVSTRRGVSDGSRTPFSNR